MTTAKSVTKVVMNLLVGVKSIALLAGVTKKLSSLATTVTHKPMYTQGVQQRYQR
jgi:hypothetical protein